MSGVTMDVITGLSAVCTDMPCMICGLTADRFGYVGLNESLNARQSGFALFHPSYRDAGVTCQGLYVCRDCGHGFVSPRLSDMHIGCLQASERGVIPQAPGWSDAVFVDTPYDSLWLRHVRLPALQRIIDLRVDSAVRLLDIGASGGTLSLGMDLPAGSRVDLMQMDTVEAHGVQRTGVRVFNGLLSALENGYVADIAFALHVLEHVDDPVAFLVSVRERMSDDGFAIIEVPFENRDAGSFASGQISSLDHKSFFTPWSLRATIDQAGLEVADIELDPYFHAGGRDSGIDHSPPAIGVIRAVAVHSKTQKRSMAPCAPRYWQARTVDAWLQSLGGSAALLSGEPFVVFVYRPGYLAVVEFLQAAGSCVGVFTTNDEIVHTCIGGQEIMPAGQLTSDVSLLLICPETDARQQMKAHFGSIMQVV